MLFFLSLIGCVTTPEVEVPQSVPQTTTEEVDFSGVFGGVVSYSQYDQRLIEYELMERVLLEESVFGEENFESWTRHTLLGWLGGAGSILVAPPLRAKDDPRSPCPEGGCYAPLPTVVLRDLSFLSGTEEFAVVVQRKPTGTLRVALRDNDKQSSLCPLSFKLPLGFMRLEAQVQRMFDGALVASLYEVRLLSVQKKNQEKTTVSAALVSPKEEPTIFCEEIKRVFNEDPSLQRTNNRFEDASVEVLDAALSPLFVPAPLPLELTEDPAP